MTWQAPPGTPQTTRGPPIWAPYLGRVLHTTSAETALLARKSRSAPVAHEQQIHHKALRWNCVYVIILGMHPGCANRFAVPALTCDQAGPKSNNNYNDVSALQAHYEPCTGRTSLYCPLNQSALSIPTTRLALIVLTDYGEIYKWSCLNLHAHACDRKRQLSGASKY